VRWHKLAVLTATCVLALLVTATPAAAYWTPWTSFARIGVNPISDSVTKSWYMPDVQGDWVVWQRTLDSAVDWNVYAYDLNTRAIKPVSTAAGNQVSPRVYGSWVVYEDHRWGNAEIYAYDLATGTERRITNRADDQMDPDIWGTKIVYTDVLPTHFHLHLYDLATSTDTTLPLDPGAQQSQASISGNRVAYTESFEIYVLDMTTGNVTRLTDNTNMDQTPDIDGTLVAWARFGNGSDIWAQDLAGGGAVLVAQTADEEEFARVSGTRVVYGRRNNTTMDVEVYDALARDRELLTSTTTRDMYPAIDGLNIVWATGVGIVGDYGGNIALGRLIAPTMSANAAASVVPYGGRTTISGSLAENGIPLGSVPIFIDRSIDGGDTWSQAAILNTNSSGTYSYTTPAASIKALFRSRYNGSLYFVSTTDHFSALSPAVSVTPRASVGKPIGYPKTGKKKSYTVYGSLNPKQTPAASSAKVVVIKCYRRQSGKWKLRKTVNAKVYDHSAVSRYQGSVSLPYTGRWRIRAYFKGSSRNAANYSSYRYATKR
jgi:beta propeller repeat protein